MECLCRWHIHFVHIWVMYLYRRYEPFSKRKCVVNCANETMVDIVLTKAAYVIVLSRLNGIDCASTLLLHIMRGEANVMWVPISVRAQNDVWMFAQFLICWGTGVGEYNGVKCLKWNCCVVGGRLDRQPFCRERIILHICAKCT